MSGTLTPNFRLQKPLFDDIPWDQAVNGNMDLIDAALAQYLTIANFAGVWKNLTPYGIGQVLVDAQDSTMWQCVVAHTSAALPSLFSADRANRPTLWSRAAGIVSPTSANTANIGRNLIHNPLFNIAQRGLGPFSTHNTYTADRWRIGTLLDVCSFNRFTSQPFADLVGDDDAQNYLTNTFTGNAGAAANTYLDHPIEKVSRLGGKTVTVSFWANAGSALKLGVNMIQLFGTGGSPSAGVLIQATGNAVTLSGTLTRYSMAFTVPSLSGKTLGTNGDDHTLLRFTYTSGANSNQAAGNIGVQSGTINLWGVQLEIDSAATPLEKPDPRYDLSNCQRFYQAGAYNYGGYNLAGGSCNMTISLPVALRGTSVNTVTPTSNFNCAIPTLVYAASAQQILVITAFATGSVSTYGTFTASADL